MAPRGSLAKQCTSCGIVAFFHRNNRSGWNRIGSDQLFEVFVGIDDDLRMQFATMLLHDQLCLTCLLVDISFCRDPFHEVFVFDISWTVADNWNIVLFPFGNL